MSDGKTKRTAASRFWGRMYDVTLPARVVSLVFVLAAIVSMSFCQLGFWPIGTIEGNFVYLMLLLAPLVMGTFMFGPITGALLGLYTGAVAYLHATYFPLDFYESFFRRRSANSRSSQS
ncbi:MAG: hypothetical protein IJ111_15270 [Eggerthellaceae bacterium]|nr:hypothetical protein [Eggerthellaceae bacterium]MBQ9044163.1 hypothetical protein [Eggerthellaceae bacterium]